MGIFLTGCVFASSSYIPESERSYIIYYKPAFDGQIIDVETKVPLQNAIVAAIYYKHTQGILGHGEDPFKIRETLTDKDGRFHIPSYFTFINPFAVGAYANILIYKPGYANGGGSEEEFSGNGVKSHEETDTYIFKGKSYKYHEKIEELPKLESKEDRLRALNTAEGLLSQLRFQNKEVIQVINDEEQFLGLKSRYGIRN
jgi:hypothetical protein